MQDLTNVETPILREMVERLSEERQSRWSMWLIPIFGCLGPVVAVLVSVCVSIKAAAVAMYVWAGLFFALMWYSHRPIERAEKLRAEQRRRESMVPWRKRLKSILMYGETWSAIECEEAHLPGDCPLCGAYDSEQDGE